MDNICLLEPIRAALRERTWHHVDGAFVAVGTECHSCEVTEAENDGALFGLAAPTEQAIEGVAYAVVLEAKKRGASKLVISPMRAELHAGREHFCARVKFD